MPTVQWNRDTWDRDYDWRAAGDEWSAAWGDAERQWHWTLRPRLQRYLPSGSILEIGPGHGRWSRFLLAECRELALVDLSQRCIDACRARFADAPNVRYVVNDGSSLAEVPSASVDLVFSFDSLVHAELDVLQGYLREFARTLRPRGVAFIHHSNLGQFGYFRRMRWLEARLGSGRATTGGHAPSQPAAPGRVPLTARVARAAVRAGLVDRTHMRALSVSAELVRRHAREHGLACVSQETFPWGGSRRAIDCISVLAHAASAETPCRTLVNRDFMREAERVRALGEVYR